ncbi:MAG: hypothetical protein Q4G33_03970 [bacterium]|nr:hypothetical protein [bacterium]
MALINGIYIHVTGENVDRNVEASTHSVEVGSDITDHIKTQPIELSLSGEIVNYTGYTSETKTEQKTINAWISLVKKDGSAFDTMSFERLNNELLAFEGGANWVNSGAVQYIDGSGNLINCALGDAVAFGNTIISGEGTIIGSGDAIVGDTVISGNPTVVLTKKKIYCVKFEVIMPYGATVRIQNAYKDYCCFNVINKSTTGYNVRDYDADAANTNDFVLSNTYNGETGRIRTEFTNYDSETSTIKTNENRSAAWVIECITNWLNTGTLVIYEGRNYLQNYQIRKFSTGHPNGITGGAEFSMTLAQFRGAVNSYTAANGAVASGGTQQIDEGDNSEVWYDVQVGDELYSLVSQYGNLKREPINGVEYSAVDWVMRKNPHAFEDVNDCSTLKACEKILLGYR